MRDWPASASSGLWEIKCSLGERSAQSQTVCWSICWLQPVQDQSSSAHKVFFNMYDLTSCKIHATKASKCAQIPRGGTATPLTESVGGANARNFSPLLFVRPAFSANRGSASKRLNHIIQAKPKMANSFNISTHLVRFDEIMIEFRTNPKQPSRVLSSWASFSFAKD